MSIDPAPTPDTPPQPQPGSLRDQLSDAKEPGFLSDLWHFIKTEKKWWLIPIAVVLGLVGLLLLLGQSAGPLAPFVYPFAG
jgi:hypothetical protein